MNISPEIFLNSQIRIGDELSAVSLCRSATGMNEESLKDLEFISKTLFSFERWLVQAAEQPPQPCSLDLNILPKRLVCKDSEIAFPPALPFLEAIFSLTHLAFGQYEICRFSESPDSNKALLSLQTCTCLCHLLDLIRKMGKKEISWKYPRWEQTTDRFRIFKDSIYTRDQLKSVYFAPGRERFAICWQNWNPYAGKPDFMPLAAEVRFDPEAFFGDQGKLGVDISVRQLSARRKEMGRFKAYTLPDSVELTDFVFGPGRHHLLIAQGKWKECVGLVKQTMEFLGVFHLIKTTAEIPRRRESTA